MSFCWIGWSMSLTPDMANISKIVDILAEVQLDLPWIAEWAYASIFAVAVQFQNKDQFWISRQKSGVVFLIFFEKPKNELVRPKMVFLVILAKF